LEENEKQFLERRHSIAALSQIQPSLKVPPSPGSFFRTNIGNEHTLLIDFLFFFSFPMRTVRHSFSYTSNYFDDQLSNIDENGITNNQSNQPYTFSEHAPHQAQYQDPYTIYQEEDLVISSNQSEHNGTSNTEPEQQQPQAQELEKQTKESSHSSRRHHKHHHRHLKRSSSSGVKKSSSAASAESSEHRKTKFLFQQRLLEIYNQTNTAQATKQSTATDSSANNITMSSSSSSMESVSSPSMFNFEPFSPSTMTFALPESTGYDKESLYEIQDNQYLESLLYQTSSATSNSSSQHLIHQQQQQQKQQQILRQQQQQQAQYQAAAHHSKQISTGGDRHSPSFYVHQLPYGFSIYHHPVNGTMSVTSPTSGSNNDGSNQPTLHPPPHVYHNCCKGAFLYEGGPHHGHYMNHSSPYGSVSPSPPPASLENQTDPYFPKSF